MPRTIKPAKRAGTVKRSAVKKAVKKAAGSRKTESGPTKMEMNQARFNHIAARGHAALEIMPHKRSAQQKQDMRLARKTFGDSEFKDKRKLKVR
jgi:hypothetical protein